MKIEQIKVILILTGWLAFFVFLARKTRQLKEELNRAKIEEPDGSLRDLTPAERMAIANYLAHKKSKYFWLPILLLVIILAILMILTMTGMLPKLIEDAAEIYVKYFLAS
ncbi:MAG: hypothetical protein GY845_13535 [Planctomycetes bacterium]|nr:hypothetical protein [Planctomycetota bacterium]